MQKLPTQKHFLLRALFLVLVFGVLAYVIWVSSTKTYPASVGEDRVSSSTNPVYTDAPVQVASSTEFKDSKEVEVETNKTDVSVADTPSTSNPNKSYSFGLSLGETLSVKSRTQVAQILAELNELGVGWIRVDLAWNTIQPNSQEEYMWGSFDTIVTEANKVGILVLPILTYTPVWARAEKCRMSSKCEPADPEAFALFAQHAVERYAPQGVYAWEVWNEPNIKKFWAGGADYARYTELLRYTYKAIHSVDAEAVVISGGLAPASTGGGNITAREFLEGMYESGAKNYFDAFGFHPYSFPLAPSDFKVSNAWSQMAETEWNLRGIMIEHGDAEKKMWLTEYGAPTDGPGKSTDDGTYAVWSFPDHVSEAYQAKLLKEAYEKRDEYSWAGPLFWYSYQDLGTSTGTIENFFGIRRYDGSEKPALSVLQLLL